LLVMKLPPFWSSSSLQESLQEWVQTQWAEQV
jgi:hypothetical protein